MLVALTKRTESFKAFNALCRTLKRRAAKQTVSCSVGYRRGLRKFPKVLRFPAEGIWAIPIKEWDAQSNSFWCGYGDRVPVEGDTLSITCQINPPHESPNLTYGGLFAKDQNGHVYLCHTGNIGGGRPGIGKQAFVNRYRGMRGSSVSVKIESRQESVEVIFLGRVDDRRLPMRISHFVHEVSRIKKEIVEGVPEPSEGTGSFQPEFSGRRRSYSVGGTIASNVDHGVVVDALAHEIEKAGYTPRNDRHRDMFVMNDGHNGMPVLFEIKTSTETTDMYQAVGQLMFNGRARQSGVKLVLVVPDELTTDTNRRIQSLDVEVLRYQWQQEKPVFRLRKLKRILD